MDLQFTDITYTVRGHWKDKGDGKTLLHGVSGIFRRCHLSAIMGPSGAGKSTLLNVLSGYSSQGVKGSLTINGKPLNRKLFHKSSRYITQEDLLPPFLTTYEAMMVAASLKLPSDTSEKTREEVVKETLKLLGLLEAAHTRTESLSGGQRKRLSIALELINNPHVFFLDEPTSGLDEFSTKQTLRLLSVLAKQDRTIVCTIHQPSATLFNFFDHVYVLGRGKCVYQGGTKSLMPFLTSAGFICPTYHNPADYIIEATDSSDINISALSKAMENGKICHTDSLVDIDNNCPLYKNVNKKEISRESSSEANNGPFQNSGSYRQLGLIERASNSQNYPVSSYRQFMILLKRMSRQLYRNKVGIQIFFLHHTLCGLLIGSVFYNAANDAHEMFNHMKFCVCYVLFHTYTNIMLPVLQFPGEVKLLKKEYFNRWYGLNPYYAALSLTKIPLQVTCGLVFNILIYFMSGLPLQTFRFSLFSLIGFLVQQAAEGLGLAIGSIFNVTNGSAVGPAAVAPLLGLAIYGFDFAKEISWLTYAMMKLSFMRCGTVATVLTLFGFGRQTLDCSEVYCHFKEPIKLLTFLDIQNVNVWTEVSTLFILLVVIRAISYYALRIRLLV